MQCDAMQCDAMQCCADDWYEGTTSYFVCCMRESVQLEYLHEEGLCGVVRCDAV